MSSMFDLSSYLQSTCHTSIYRPAHCICPIRSMVHPHISLSIDRYHPLISRLIGYHPHISRSIGTIHTSLDRSGTIHTSLDRSHTIHHLSIDRVPSTLLSIDRVPSTHLSIDRIPSTHRRTSTSFQKKPIRAPIREPSSCRIRMNNNYVASPRVTMAI